MTTETKLEKPNPGAGLVPFAMGYPLPTPSWKGIDTSKPCGQKAGVAGTIHWAVLEDIAESDYYDKWALWVSLFDPAIKSSTSESYVTGSTSSNMYSSKLTGYSQGWFLVGSTVKISVVGNKIPILTAYGPGNADQSGTSSSSISLNAGFFGMDPTANANFSNSVSVNIQGISYFDETDKIDNPQTVQTCMAMGMNSGGKFTMFGEPINSTTLLLARDNTHYFNFYLADAMFAAISIEPHAPAENSYKNQQLITQGIWMLPKGFDTDLVVQLEIDLVLGFVQNYGNDKYAQSANYQFVTQVTIPFSQLAPQIETLG